MTARRRAETEVRGLAEEQAALRRVATLVAQGVPPSELFGAVALEAGALLGADFSGMLRYEGDAYVATVATWAAGGTHPPVPDRFPTEAGDPMAIIAQTRQAARVDDWAAVPGPIAAVIRTELGVRSSVGTPIVVEGRLWGALAVHSTQSEPLPPDTESRISQFADLAATAIANAEARAEVERLAEEQAALRRVATLVAEEPSPAEVFAKIVQEVAHVLGDVDVALLRAEGDGTATVVAIWGVEMSATLPVGTRIPVDDDGVAATAMREGRPVRADDYSQVTGAIAQRGHRQGMSSGIGCPVVVRSRVWGLIGVARFDGEPLPPEIEPRLTQFGELVATAIANAEARAEVQRLADEQAALRRVATLVAREAAPDEVFAAVAEEVGLLLRVDAAAVWRYDSDAHGTVVGSWGDLGGTVPVGRRMKLAGDSVTSLVYRTQRPARFDAYESTAGAVAAYARDVGLRSAVGTPIVVGGHLWGSIGAATMRPEPVPVNAESRMVDFSELVARAISNASARSEVERLAEEQAALRRVATMVAREAPPEEVLAAVGEEVGLLLQVDAAWVWRYEPDGHGTVVGSWGELAGTVPVGRRMKLDRDSVAGLVYRTSQPARCDTYENTTGAVAAYGRESGLRSAVGTPIVVGGRLWGSIGAATTRAEPIPADAESRMAQFTELVATAISNLQARSDLAASRARIVATADEERRHVVRDLHDGAQQRLVHTIVTLKLVRRALDRDPEDAPALVDEALRHAQTATDELRELAHGILPSSLTHGGLRAGVRALASRMAIPVETDISADRLPGAVEATAYFIVAEALTNVAKHSHADRATVSSRLESHTLRVEVGDNGVGGAQADGTGLLGLKDRLAVLDGSLRIESPARGGTLIAASIPVT